jgi:hypothetical protein
MRKVLNVIGILIFLFIGITGGFIFQREEIPYNAKIYIIEEYHVWIPKVQWAEEIFREQTKNNPNAERSYKNKIISTYFEIKKGKYKECKLPPSWIENDGRKRIIWGSRESLLRSWVFPKKRRWNKDGSWNW